MVTERRRGNQTDLLNLLKSSTNINGNILKSKGPNDNGLHETVEKMMSAEDFGPDFHFERDPMALASILNEEGITPASRAAAKAPESRPFRTGLTPASKRQLNSALMRKQTEYDFYEGKNGSVFYRPKPHEASVGHLSGSKPGPGFGREAIQ